MRVKRIIPCVCITSKPDTAISTHYGMPELRVAKSSTTDKEFWQIHCPKCKRGGLLEFKSQYYALKNWNEMQLDLWRHECTDFWEGDILPNIPEWRREMYKEIINYDL